MGQAPPCDWGCGLRALAAQERRLYHFFQRLIEVPRGIVVVLMSDAYRSAFCFEPRFILEAGRRQPINATRSSARRCV